MVAFLIQSNHCFSWGKLVFILVNWDCDNVLAEVIKQTEANTGPLHEGELTGNGAGPTADGGGNYLTLLHWHSEWFTCLLFQFQWYMQHSINISSYSIDVIHTDHLILVNTLRLFWCSAPGYIAAIVRSDDQISCLYVIREQWGSWREGKSRKDKYWYVRQQRKLNIYIQIIKQIHGTSYLILIV